MQQNVFSDKKYSGGCISDFRILIITAKKNKGGSAADDDYADDAIFGGASFNDDEIDLDGFEISEGASYA